ncbi:calcium-activated chloride channel-domain-containing protein [Yarrowia lipolytica]|uniref:Calcium-activated chloride channel-domain-containing protein n=1 Tax=Yarrowia lipolytica TaxID=4952 RepID=A0A371CAB7_YARLL|nr:calcium-activated chloride channel-domain-containing protein [Yarrowia lipolytica]
MAKNFERSIRSGQAGVGVVPGSRAPTEGELERAKYGPMSTATHGGERGVHIDATGYNKDTSGVGSGVGAGVGSSSASSDPYSSGPTRGVTTNIGESPAGVNSGVTGIPSGGAVAAADTAVDVVTNEIPQTEAAGQHLKELGSPENPAVNPTGEVHTKLRADGFPTEETPRYAPSNQFDGFTGSTPLGQNYGSDYTGDSHNLNSTSPYPQHQNQTIGMPEENARNISAPYESTQEGPGVAGQTPVHREIYTETREPIIGSGSTTAAVKGVPPTDGVIADAHAQVTSLGSSVDAHKTTAVSGVDSSGLRKRVDHVEVTKTSVIKETPPPPPLPHLAPQDQIQYFDADYVIVVKPQGAEKDLHHIEQLTGLLAANHIDTKVRDGLGNELLVFLKFSDIIIDRAASHSHVNDFLYHLRSDNPRNLKKDSFEQLREHSKEYKSSERLRLVHHYLSAPEIDGGLGIDPSNPKFAYIDEIFPLQDRKKNKQYAALLGSKWVVDDEDLDAINDLYGEQVAFYFGFSQFYLQWLIVPSIVGVLAHFLLPSYSFFYTLVIQIWSIVFVRAWRKRETNLAIRFGATNASAVGERRAFIAEGAKIDMISDIKRPWYSPSKRVAKELAFIPVAFTLAALLVVGHTIIFAFEIYTRQIYHGPFSDYAPLVPTALLVVFLGVFKVIYGIIAKKMTDWENHEFEGVYTRSLTIKLFVVDFLSSYFGLFLTGFIYLPFGQNLVGYLNVFQELINFLVGDTVVKPFTVDSSRLYDQMIYFLGTAQVINFVLSRALPIVIRFALPVISKIRGVVVAAPVELAPQEEHYMDIVRGERSKSVYDVTNDYRSTITQFGFVALFGPVWALGPLCALIHNFLSLRSEFLKISVDFQRPTPRRVENIQPWDDILTFITWLGSLSTTALVVMLRSVHYDNDAAVAFTNVRYVSVSQTLGIDGTSLGVVTVAPWFVLAAVLYAEHQYLFVSRLTDFIFSQFDSPEVITDKRSRYQLRKALLAAEGGSENVKDIVFSLSPRGGQPPRVDIQTVDVILKRRRHPAVPNTKKAQ